MTIQSYKLGPGSLTIGSGPLDTSAQATAVTVEWEENVESTDTISVLSGEELTTEDDVTYRAKLTATFLQDELGASGLVAYTWSNKGTEQPFTFVPNSSLDRQVTGTLRVVPLNIGGDVKARNSSDVTFSIIGDPVLGDTP